MNPSNQPSSDGDMADSIRELTNEIRRLWQAVNELRDEVFEEYPDRRDKSIRAADAPAARPPLRLKSMSLDPCDPDFGRKINAVDVAAEAAMPPERPRAATLAEFIARLTSEPSAVQINFDQWAEGAAVDSGVVVTVDDELFDWFADHFEAEYEAPGGAYVLAGDNGGQFVLWSNESDIFLRQLTETEAVEFAELMRIAAEKAALIREQFQVSQAPHKQQGSLW